MGYYINGFNGKYAPAKGKVQFLIEHANAKVIPTPTEFQENLVCVVRNEVFDAAGYCHSEKEMQLFMYPEDNRPKTWLIVPHADILSGYDKNEHED